VVSFKPWPLYSRERDRRLDGSRYQSGRREEEKYPTLYRDSNSVPSAVLPVASRYTECAIPAPYIYVYDVILSVISSKVEVKYRVHHTTNYKYITQNKREKHGSLLDSHIFEMRSLRLWMPQLPEILIF
jgi:hypothetical protein